MRKQRDEQLKGGQGECRRDYQPPTVTRFPFEDIVQGSSGSSTERGGFKPFRGQTPEP